MSIEPTKIVNADVLLLAGIDRHYTFQTMGEISTQWQIFIPQIASVEGVGGKVAYGLCYDMNDGGFQYVSAVEVRDAANLPSGFTSKLLPAQRYAVFQHEDELSKLSITIDAIWHQWLPQSGEQLTESPIMFERYGENFDPVALKGDLEIWIAIKA